MQSVATLNQQMIMDRGERRHALNQTVERVMNRLLGCWLHELGRPFTYSGRTYRSCVKCGMSRDFDAASWKTHGHTYRLNTVDFGYGRVRTTSR